AHQPSTQEVRRRNRQNSSRRAAGNNHGDPVANEQRNDLLRLSANSKSNTDLSGSLANFIRNDPEETHSAQEKSKEGRADNNGSRDSCVGVCAANLIQES